MQKMSKSLNNYISVIDSPKEMFGKTMRVSDELMIRWYELLTDKTASDLERIKAGLKSRELHPRQVKVDLAKFLIRRFHSQQAAEAAEAEFNRMFVDKGLPEDMPTLEVGESQEGIWICQLLSQASLTESNSEARRLVKQKAVEIDGVKIEDENFKVQLKKGAEFVLRAGKRKFAKVIVK